MGSGRGAKAYRAGWEEVVVTGEGESGGGLPSGDSGQQDRSVFLPQYDALTPEQRKQRLDYLIINPLLKAGKARVPVKDQVDDEYRLYSINPDSPGLAEYVKEISGMNAAAFSANKYKEMAYLRDHPRLLDHDRKIHLQPISFEMLLTVKDLAEFIAGNEAVREGIVKFKVRTSILDAMRGINASPFIVIYLSSSVSMEELIRAFSERFKNYSQTPAGDTPRFNQRNGSIVFSAVGDGGIKQRLQREGILKRYYNPATNYASVRSDVQHASPSALTKLRGLFKNKL